MERKTKMDEKQVENLLNYSEQERFDYFVRYCSDFYEVWGLVVGEDNWVIFTDKEGNEIFPLWSHKHLASICMFDEHRKMNASAQRISLDVFLEECVPDMKRDEVLFGVFFDLKREALVVTPELLYERVREELLEYE